MPRRRDTATLEAASILAYAVIVGLALAVLDLPWAGLLALPMLVFLPGYALYRAFARRSRSMAEAVLVGFGSSLAMTALGGIIIALSPIGLTRLSAIALASGLTGITALVWLIRLRGRSPETGVVRPQGAGSSAAAAPLGRRQVRPLLPYGLAAALALVAVVVAVQSAASQGVPHVIQAWFVPAGGPAAMASFVADPGSSLPASVVLGVRNAEGEDISCAVQVSWGTASVSRWPQATLHDGETWTGEATVPAGLAPGTRANGVATCTAAEWSQRGATCVDDGRWLSAADCGSSCCPTRIRRSSVERTGRCRCSPRA